MHTLRTTCGGGLLAVWLLCGCGGGPKTATVAGMVDLDGAPLETGKITFTPADGLGQTVGADVEDGRYTLKSSPGLMKVSISSPKIVGEKKLYPTPGSPVMTVTEEAIPKRYNAETALTLEVTGDMEDADFQLESE